MGFSLFDIKRASSLSMPIPERGSAASENSRVRTVSCSAFGKNGEKIHIRIRVRMEELL